MTYADAIKQAMQDEFDEVMNIIKKETIQKLRESIKEIK